MAVTNILGYVIAGLGLLGIVASSQKIKAAIPVIKDLPLNYMIIASGVLVIAGIVLLIVSGKGGSSGNIRQASEEVPIYEGEGRRRKIVGYKRA